MADSFAGSDVVRIDFNGTDNATTVTDSLGHTFTAGGAAKIKTTKPKYGTASFLMDGTTGCVFSSANSADWNMGSGDFCVDFFYEATAWATSTGHNIFGIGDGTTAAMRINTYASGGNGSWLAEVSIGSTLYTLTGDVGALIAGTTYHLSFVRTGGYIYFARDGMRVGVAVAVSGSLDWNTNMLCVIGGSFTGQSPNGGSGYIDQFRLTKGQARYTYSGYTPPVDGSFNTVDSTIGTITTGTNSRQVTVYGQSTNPDAIIEAVDRAIVALGWEVYDSNYRGTVTKVYRCLNKDATSYKYMMLIWDKVRCKLIQTSLESWDLATGAITNETWSNNRTDCQHGWAYNNMDIMIMGSTRYLAIMTYVQGHASAWSACVETEREAAEDTAGAGFPCWGMVYTHSLLHRQVTNITDWIRMPRTRDGAVGVNAARNQTLVTTMGMWGTATAAIGSAATTSYITRYSSAASTGMHGWDNTKKLISSLKIIKDNALTDLVLHVYGRMFGFKVTPPIVGAETMDKVSIPVDADMFYDAAGTQTSHWVLPSVLPAVTTVNGSAGSVPSVSAFSVGAIGVQDMVSTGSFAYLATTASGVYKTNLVSGVTTAVASTTGLVTAVCFDGRYVYASNTTGIYRIDTTNADAVTSVTVGVGGVKAMTLHGKQFLFASQRTAAATCTVHKIDLQSWIALGSANITAKTTASTINALASDGLKTICAVSGNGTTAADQTISYIDAETLTPTNYSFPSTPLGLSQGVEWSGQHWVCSVHTDSSSVTTYIMSGNSGTSLYTITAFTATNVTSASPNRVFISRVGPATLVITPATAVAAPASGGASVANIQPDASGAAVLGVTGSTLTATSGIRCAATHGNALLAMGVDNNLYVVGTLNRKGLATTNYANLLLPR